MIWLLLYRNPAGLGLTDEMALAISGEFWGDRAVDTQGYIILSSLVLVWKLLWPSLTK